MESIHPLKAFRELRQLSPADLARLLEVSPAAVSRWESGERNVDRRLLPKITEKTGISAKELRPDLAELMSEAAE
jgi:transcriptional regulator with XRE-family HTH domain